MYSTKDKLTGYPSIDKPWLQYYPEGVLSVEIPSKTMYQLIYESNVNRMENVAINYFDRKIIYNQFFQNVDRMAQAFVANGI